MSQDAGEVQVPARGQAPPPRLTAPASLRPRHGARRTVMALESVAGPVAGAPETAAVEPMLDAQEIQGNIWPGFNTAHLMLLGLRFRAGEEAQARLWLRDLHPLVSSMADVWHAREVRRAVAKATGMAPPRPDIFLNVALSFSALSPLGLPTDHVTPGAFTAGMAGVDLQDPVDAAGRPVDWKLGDTEATTPQVLLVLGADDEPAFRDAVRILKARTGPGSGVDVMYEDEGTRLPDEREHFGFRDGISQPGMRGRLNEHPESFVTRRYLDADDPLAERFAKPGQPLIWPGQFIFGYPAQDSFSEDPGAIAIPPEAWMKNGSFLVFRRLRQKVDEFRAFCAAQAVTVSQQLGRVVSADEVAGWIVGRWPDGSALVRCPVAPCAADSGEEAINHFDYADAVPDSRVNTPAGPQAVSGAPGDAQGQRCPFFGHVRKVNLRDKPTDITPSVFFRILRRGIPFGPAFQEGEAPGVDRGLLFISYQQSLEQFMTLSARWMNQATSPEGPNGHDLLVGQSHNGRFATRTFADGTTARMDSPAGSQWVIPSGGGFFFTPARSVLAGLGGPNGLA